MADLKTEAEQRQAIPEILGKTPNDFFNNSSRVVDVYLEDGCVGFVPSVSNNPSALTSAGYASEHYGDDFEYWHKTATEQVYQGYLVGFPEISIEHQDPALEKIPSMHFWCHNSDVLTHSFAVPLTAVRGLFVYSNFFTKMSKELDEMSMGADSSYEVPILRNKRTSKTYYRDASYDDILHLIKDETPALIYKSYDLEVPYTSYRMFGDAALKQLFA